MSLTAVLTDAQRARIEPLMPSSDGSPGRPLNDHRLVVEGIVYRFRAGIPWRDLPECFGSWKTVWKRHRRFSGDGTWDRIHTRLLAEAEEDRMKAHGFVERSGMVICGGLPASEMALLIKAVPLSRQEQQKLVSWQDPPAWDSRGVDVEPPGRGKFLIKVGGRPGIPVQIGLTSVEAKLNDTNKRWHDKGGKFA